MTLLPVPGSLLPQPSRFPDPLVIPAVSLEPVRVPVVIVRGGVVVDPTIWPVQLALPVYGQPPDTWVDGTWERENRPGPPLVAYYGWVLVGPDGDVELATGRYDVWIRVQMDDAQPARKAGVLLVE